MHNNLEEFRAGTQTPPRVTEIMGPVACGGFNGAVRSGGRPAHAAASSGGGVRCRGPPIVATPVELAFRVRVENSRDRSGTKFNETANCCSDR